ncbi:MAG: hypothetical protein PHW87_07455 [Methanothrix sp.]|nr:hypothetical protein [Methanothrix sp.]
MSGCELEAAVVQLPRTGIIRLSALHTPSGELFRQISLSHRLGNKSLIPA